MNQAHPGKTKHVTQPDRQDNTEPGERRPHFLPIVLRAVLPVAALALGWIGYSILSVEPEDLLSTKPVLTMIGGEVVFERDRESIQQASGTLKTTP